MIKINKIHQNNSASSLKIKRNTFIKYNTNIDSHNFDEFNADMLKYSLGQAISKLSEQVH